MSTKHPSSTATDTARMERKIRFVMSAASYSPEIL